MRESLKRVTFLKVCVAGLRVLARQYGLGVRWIGGIGALFRFRGEYGRFRRLNSANAAFALAGADIIPCLTDRTSSTPVEPIYFVQDTWFAGRLAQLGPAVHVDVGSSAKTMALVAQFVPVTMVDIRPVELPAADFSFVKGSILALPFADESIASLSSLCVIEHIGLGRYGDEPDPFGSEKAWRELVRVLAPGGDFYVSVPVDSVNRIYFNAHRAFTRDCVLSLSAGLDLIQEQYLYGTEVVPAYEPARGFGTGMFHLRKL